MNETRRDPVDVILASRSDVLHLTPVIKKLREMDSASVRIIIIQEYGYRLKDFLTELELSPDVCWSVRGTKENQNLILAEVFLLLNELWCSSVPSWLINFGHSGFTHSCLMAALQNNVPVAHIHDSNSNLSQSRTDQKRQRAVTEISDIHFTANIQIKNSLIADGIHEGSIFSVGSTIPDFGRDILENKRIDLNLRDEVRDFIKRASSVYSVKIIAIELDSPQTQPELNHHSAFPSAGFGDAFRLVYFSCQWDNTAQVAITSKSYDGTAPLILNNWERWFLFTQSACVVSTSTETIDEARAFGSHGILLQRQTKRLDLLADGKVNLADSLSEIILDGACPTLNQSARPRYGTVRHMHSQSKGASASEQIAEALTSQKGEIFQRLKTAPQFQRAE